MTKLIQPGANPAAVELVTARKARILIGAEKRNKRKSRSNRIKITIGILNIFINER